ncbi:MAG: hypothetical protein K2R98_24285 [Gemmataceae bacterium]|nr:hypothetical protein [Gemmataceae bacterium]
MFRVEWLQTAIDDLAAIWVQADSNLRQAITNASHQIDQQLSSDPFGPSESRSEGRRILFVFPLGISFRMESDEQTVTVLHVWQFGRRGRQVNGSS